MHKRWRRMLVWSFCLILMGVRAEAQTSHYQKECSENAKQLLKKAWAIQPMNIRGNNRGLLMPSRNHEKANEYNELFLREAPNDATALLNRANLISILQKDYSRALEIKMSLLRLPEYNRNGIVFYEIARTYSLTNELDESLAYLKLALTRNKTWGNKLNAQVDSSFENLKKDSRFWSLVN
jgi:tetratricopeptide (TPR) repeat protein